MFTHSSMSRGIRKGFMREKNFGDVVNPLKQWFNGKIGGDLLQ